MNKWVVGSTACAAALTALAIFASQKGWGVPQPEKEPLSIREESVRGSTSPSSGRYRTRYFLRGGGPARGK